MHWSYLIERRRLDSLADHITAVALGAQGDSKAIDIAVESLRPGG